MKVLICGGQNYHDEKHVFAELDARRDKITSVIEGGGKGVAAFARSWALKRKIHVDEFRADVKLGKRTRITRRNEEMIAAQPDLVLAFTGGADTEQVIAKARANRIPVEMVEEVADLAPICPSCGVRQDVKSLFFDCGSVTTDECSFCNTLLSMRFEDHKWKCEEIADEIEV